MFCISIFLKAEVDDGPQYPDLQDGDYTYHHIIPNNKVELLVNKHLTKESVEEYVNKQHIKTVIIKNKLIVKRQKGDHGKVIHASISNNPHNFVRGPTGAKRGDDPKQKVDAKILSRQSNEYQQAAKPFLDKNSSPTLKQFGDLPRTVPVQFTKISGQYYVEKVWYWDTLYRVMFSITATVIYF